MNPASTSSVQHTAQPIVELAQKSIEAFDTAFRMLERGFAYSFATQVIEGGCPRVGPDGEDWFNTTPITPLDEPDLADAIVYLETRRLLHRHPLALGWVKVLDESEAA